MFCSIDAQTNYHSCKPCPRSGSAQNKKCVNNHNHLATPRLLVRRDPSDTATFVTAVNRVTKAAYFVKASHLPEAAGDFGPCPAATEKFYEPRCAADRGRGQADSLKGLANALSKVKWRGGGKRAHQRQRDKGGETWQLGKQAQKQPS